MRNLHLSARRHGLALFYMILLMGVLCILLSLAVDMARVQVAKTELMRATDAAARAACSRVPGNLFSATALAMEYGSYNKCDVSSGVTIDPNDVIFGSWNDSTRTFTALSGSAATMANAVKVTARRTGAETIPLLFGRALGANNCDLTSTAIAYTQVPLGNYAIVGLDEVDLNGWVKVDSYVGTYSSGSARYHGNIASNGDIDLNFAIEVKGNANPGVDGQTNIGFLSKVWGSTESLEEPIQYGVVTPGNLATNNDNSKVTAINSSTRNLVDAGLQQVNFPTGTYYINDLKLWGGTFINANIDGPVTIYVSGEVEFKGLTVVWANRPENLQIIVIGNGHVEMEGLTATWMSLFAPRSTVRIWGFGAFYGQYVGRTIDLDGLAQFHYDEQMANKFESRRIMIVQ